MVPHLLRKAFWKRPSHMSVSGMSTERADVEDVRYAYRLLLGRLPDPQGLETCTRLVRDQVLTPFELAERFLGSNEFHSRYKTEPVEVNLGSHVLVVRADDTDVGRAVATTRQWEPHVVTVLHRYLQPGGRFLDVGANIGYFTAWAAHRVGSAGRVVAVEPMDKNAQLIYATVARNGFTQVRVEPFAASDAAGVICMGTHPGTSNGEILGEGSHGGSLLYAQACRLDDRLAGESRFDVVKFDIEGHELHAWRGFSRTLERERPIVLTEFHPHCLRRNAKIEPEVYGAVLLNYGTVTVLHFDGRHSACQDIETLMRLWASEDAALGTDGTAHLDLLVEPRY
ncbi:MAG TPA: FkbM family methyltransferase [Dokdonella sp.]|uniref:FkbM family methyltransferase n=1 Tax=Dokdonella sp. TaxID=2291710 RepID=UPI002CB31BB5|nr:FkbM family methyltransferase [Dokdonella sp.]HUD41725.1 FkbM family methyltransferase [Dokdonella sp.]